MQPIEKIVKSEKRVFKGFPQCFSMSGTNNEENHSLYNVQDHRCLAVNGPKGHIR
jgi:hypothetical protein